MTIGVSIQKQAEKGFGLLNLIIGENGCGKSKEISALGYQNIFVDYDSEVWEGFDFSLIYDRFDWLCSVKRYHSHQRELVCVDRYTGLDVYMKWETALVRYAYILAVMSSRKNAKLFIDNIDCSFNPKLGCQLIIDLAPIAKKNNNQLLAIAYNPATLDGLDLNDDDQRLYVAYRTIDGKRTCFKRVYALTQSEPEDDIVTMSEAWLNGYIGGLPNNF